MSDPTYTSFEFTEAEWAMGLQGWKDVIDSGQLGVETPSDERFVRFVEENLPVAQEPRRRREHGRRRTLSACEGSEGSKSPESG